MSYGNVSFLSSFLLSSFFPKLGRRVFHSTAWSSHRTFRRQMTTICCLGDRVVIEKRKKFWPFAMTASLAGRATKIFTDRSVRVTIARYHREQRILRRGIPSSSSCNLVCKHARARARARGRAFVRVRILSSAGSPPAILLVRPTKGPPPAPGPAYLVCCNNEIMADAPRLTKQCGLLDRCSAVFLPSSLDERSPRIQSLSLHFPHGKWRAILFPSPRSLSLLEWLQRPTRKDNVSGRIVSLLKVCRRSLCINNRR